MDPAEIQRQFERYQEMFRELEAEQQAELDRIQRSLAEQQRLLEAAERDVISLHTRREVAATDAAALQERHASLRDGAEVLRKEVAKYQSSAEVTVAALMSAQSDLEKKMEEREAAAEQVILLQVELREIQNRKKRLEQEESQLERQSEEQKVAMSRSLTKMPKPVAHEVPDASRIAALIQRLTGLTDLASRCVQRPDT